MKVKSIQYFTILISLGNNIADLYQTFFILILGAT